MSRSGVFPALTASSRWSVGVRALLFVGSRPSAPRANAIATRCLKPPDSWCGHCRRRCATSGTATSRSTCSARSRYKPLSLRRRPTRIVGLRAPSGSWNTAPRRCLRTLRRCAAVPLSMSTPPTTTSPFTAARGPAIPSRHDERTLLPEPDSPTRATISPRAISRSTPRRAWMVPRFAANSTLRLRIDAIGPSVTLVLAVLGRQLSAADRRPRWRSRKRHRARGQPRSLRESRRAGSLD
ncbi:unannotated protein [freshwater metagenome]|uniref:Unannotated protein n=1 Tax=freshwater metagenome TaxID=449393 RepID=A0A6J7U581_9ZZZZ